MFASLNMMVGNVFVTLLSVIVFRTVRSRIAFFDAPIFCLVWVFVATSYTLLLGVSGLLDGHKIGVISLAGLIPCAIALWLCRGRGASFAVPFPAMQFRPSLLGCILCFLAVIQLVRIAVYFWYIPPYVWDTVVYHLVNVAEWIQKGRVFAVNTPVERVYWPASFEVLEAWFAVFLHNDVLIKFPSFIYYVMCGAAAHAIARILGINRLLAMIVCALYLFTPSLAIQATACKNDVAIAALYLLCVAILLDILVNGNRHEFPLFRQLLIIGMALCLGVGIKPYIVFMMPGLAILGIGALWRIRREPGSVHEPRGLLKWFSRWRKEQGILSLGIAVVLIAACLLLSSYWYVRNYVDFGNPFYPTNFTVGNHIITGTIQPEEIGPAQRRSPSFMGLLRNGYSLITFRIFDPYPYSSHLHNESGWGWFSFICGMCATGYVLIFVGRLRILVACFAVSLLCLFSMVSTDPWFMRFTLWVPCLFALCFAVLVSELGFRWARTGLLGLAFACTVLNFVGVLNGSEITAADFGRMKASPAGRRRTADLNRYAKSGYKETWDVVPLGEPIGFCFPNNGCGYPLYDSNFSRLLEYIPIKSSDFVETMRSKRTRFLFVQRLSEVQNQLILNAVESGRLVKLREYLYALR